MQIRNGSLLSSLRTAGQKSVHNAHKVVHSGKKVAVALTRLPLVQLINEKLNSDNSITAQTAIKTVKDDRQKTTGLDTNSANFTSEVPLSAEDTLEQQQLSKELALNVPLLTGSQPFFLLPTDCCSINHPWYLATQN